MAYTVGIAVSHDNPGLGLKATGAINQYLLVKADLSLCASDENQDWIGATTNLATAAGQNVPVRFPSAGSLILTMAVTETIAIGAPVYKAAGGKITAVSTYGKQVGIALTAGATAGDWLEVLPI